MLLLCILSVQTIYSTTSACIAYEPVLPNVLSILVVSVRWQLHTLWAFLDISLAGANAQCVCNLGLGHFTMIFFRKSPFSVSMINKYDPITILVKSKEV